MVKELRASVVYRTGPLTVEDYEEAIEKLQEAQRELISGEHRGCGVCGDSGHLSPHCHHNPLVMARQAAKAQIQYRCFHCEQVFEGEEDARAHFGPDARSEAKCLPLEITALRRVVFAANALMECLCTDAPDMPKRELEEMDAALDATGLRI